MKHINKFDSFINENASQSNKEAAEALDLVTQLDAESMEIFFRDLSQYFYDNEVGLENMDAGAIGDLLAKIQDLIKARYSN